MPRPLLAMAAALSLLVAACGGGNDEPATEQQPEVTAQGAIAEIAEVRRGLERGLAAYRDGDAEAAEREVSEAYLQHFELVEVPLEERDPELNEQLEELIREELREAIERGQPVAEVRGLVEEANEGLDRAERELRQ